MPKEAPRISVSSLLILLGIFLLLGYEVSKLTSGLFRQPAIDQRPVAARGDLAEDEKSTIELFKRVSPSVVYITTTAQRFDLRTFNPVDIPLGTGSGFVWDDAGDIVTNFHVVAVPGARGAKVTLAGNKTYDADLVGVSPENDIAVLRIKAPKEDLRPIAVGSSEDLQVGQKVFAIGNPFGLDHTLTTGIISALGRAIPRRNEEPLTNLIQTDAAINPGNSGGPLLDSAGRLIGVNTAIQGETGYNIGIGFALPVDSINHVVAQLITNGRMVYPETGIQTSDLVSREFGVRGIVILRVKPGSPAEKAGLRPVTRSPEGDIVAGDIVLNINGTAVRTEADMERVMRKTKPGDTIQVELFREGQVVTVPLKLDSRTK